jgi:hypothetical protein
MEFAMADKRIKPSRKGLSKWACGFGCDVSSHLCAHIERTLPNVDFYKYMAPIGDTDFVAEIDTTSIDEKEQAFLDLLDPYGLDEWETALLVDHHVCDLSMREIARRRGSSKQTVGRRLNEVHEKLKRRGFKKERESE